MRRSVNHRFVLPAVLCGVLGLMAGGGYSLASSGGGATINACVHKGTHLLYVGRCNKRDTKLSWEKVGAPGQTGPMGRTGPNGDPGAPGPSGVVNMVQFDASSHALVTGFTWGFISSTPQLAFTDAKTVAQVTGTVDFGSTNSSAISLVYGVCYEPAGSSSITNVSYVVPTFPAPGFFPTTISGVVSGLSPGTYLVGVCARSESPNAQNGFGAGTVILAETQ
jgi:hypothetical protein